MTEHLIDARLPIEVQQAMAHRERVEALARILVAQNMRLVSDPLGVRQPEALYERRLAEAQAILLLTAPRGER